MTKIQIFIVNHLFGWKKMFNNKKEQYLKIKKKDKIQYVRCYH